MNSAALRIQKVDIPTMKKEPPPGISGGCMVGDSLFNWHALVHGPSNTPFEGGLFRVLLELPENYPAKPPVVTFLSAMYHPNVYPSGKVCVDILGEKWSPDFRIRDVLVSLQSLLADPNVKSPANWDASEDFEKHPERFRQKVEEAIKRSESYVARSREDAGVNYNVQKEQHNPGTNTQSNADESNCCIQ